MPVAEKLDPFQAYLPYKLYRESTRYIKGKIVKVSLVFLSLSVPEYLSSLAAAGLVVSEPRPE